MRRLFIFSLLFLVINAFAVGLGAVAFLIACLFSGNVVLDLAAGMTVMAVCVWGMLTASARLAPVRRPGLVGLIASVLILIGVGGVLAYSSLEEALSPAPPEADAATIKALGERTLPLVTVEPHSGFEDLLALKPILEGKRIVALGEATHGTREFFRMKHRMLEFLVTVMGFEHFGMETGAGVEAVIHEYIHGGAGDPRTVLYWPWATEEVMAMLDWMRAYNADLGHSRKLAFHGIDPVYGERDSIMAENIGTVLEENGPQSKIVLWAHNAHVSMLDGRMGDYLKRKFGDQAYIIGFEFNEGQFTSRMLTVHTYSERPASTAHYAHALARLSQPILFLDFKTMSGDPVLRQWLKKDQSSHEFQELHAIFRLVPRWHTLHISWPRMYDGLIFIDQSTPAVGLP